MVALRIGKSLLAIALFSLSSCNYAPDPVLAAAASSPATCSSEADCSSKWSQAVAWVARNAPYKISIQTGSLIETYGPTEDNGAPGVRVTRTRNGDGSGEIDFEAICNAIDRIYGICSPNPVNLRGRFNLSVGGGG